MSLTSPVVQHSYFHENTGADRPIRQNPFHLYQPDDDTESFNRVMIGGRVGIRRGCYEPRNETAASIAATNQSGFDAAAANCSHVKPIFWHTNTPDFDGDEKADMVMFFPQGRSTEWSGKEPDDQLDFMVLLSGMGYSARVPPMAINLTTAADPAPIPLYHDFDNDQRTDFAVFEPATGTVRILFSMSGYSKILEWSDSAVADPTGARGLVAFAGKFSGTAEDTDNNQVIVIPTGGAASERYTMYLSSGVIFDPKKENAIFRRQLAPLNRRSS